MPLDRNLNGNFQFLTVTPDREGVPFEDFRLRQLISGNKLNIVGSLISYSCILWRSNSLTEKPWYGKLAWPSIIPMQQQIVEREMAEIWQDCPVFHTSMNFC